MMLFVSFYQRAGIRAAKPIVQANTGSVELQGPATTQTGFSASL